VNRAAWRLPEGDVRQMVYIVMRVFLFYPFAVQVSGDINENREFWVALSVAWTGGRSARSDAVHAGTLRATSAGSTGGPDRVRDARAGQCYVGDVRTPRRRAPCGELEDEASDVRTGSHARGEAGPPGA
jgi:hypothetical protein